MADNETKYWAFLSCSPQDNREQPPDSPGAGRRCWGTWLHDELENFSIPADFVGQINGRGEVIPERIEPIFTDESELAEDASLGAEIRQALEQSISLMPDFAPANELLGFFEMVQGDNLTAAGQHLVRAIQLEPENRSYLLSLAQLELHARKPDAARQTLQPLLLPNVDGELRTEAQALMNDIEKLYPAK